MPKVEIDSRSRLTSVDLFIHFVSSVNSRMYSISHINQLNVGIENNSLLVISHILADQLAIYHFNDDSSYCLVFRKTIMDTYDMAPLWSLVQVHKKCYRQTILTDPYHYPSQSSRNDEMYSIQSQNHASSRKVHLSLLYMNDQPEHSAFQ